MIGPRHGGRVALLASAAALVALSCHAPLPIPTYEVVARDFTHRVIAEGFLVSADATILVVPRQVRHGGRILWMAEDGAEVAAGEVVMRLDHYELEQQLEKELSQLESADVERRRATTEGRASIDEAVTRKDLAGLELEHAERFRRDDETLFSRNEIADSQIAEELARTRRGRAAELETIEGDRARAQVDRVDVQRRLAGLEVDLARAALRALELRAPRAGVLIWSRDWRGETARIGEQVFRGQPIAEIPDLSQVEAEVFVLEADADGVVAGKRATITIDARPEHAYEARVARVEPIARRRFRGSPAQYVGVTLSLAAIDRAVMKPGQRVTASIVIADQPEGMVLPRVAVFADQGSYYVWVARDGGFERRTVLVRDLAPGLALLEGGVAMGEEVAMEEPPAAADAREAPGTGGEPAPAVGG